MQGVKILVTGAAGFIGAAVIRRLLREPEQNVTIVGLDNINDYYDVELKYARLASLGIVRPADGDFPWGELTDSVSEPSFRFIRLSLQDTEELDRLFGEERFDYVVNLAAQAGVRYSIDHPRTYIESNVDGFLNILEGCRNTQVKHLVYASSSSVYGLNGKVPFSEHDPVGHPVSLYAATKRANELMAHAYSHLYGIPTTGLRFFTVYGPWGRPDMSPFLFIDAILHDRPIKVYNNGNMFRDFTFIDDIVEGVVRILSVIPAADPTWTGAEPDVAASSAPFRIYNIGNSSPVNLMDYIRCIERASGKEAVKEMLPMQAGDVYRTYADSSALCAAVGFRPATPLDEGIAKTVEWFRNYYGL